MTSRRDDAGSVLTWEALLGALLLVGATLFVAGAQDDGGGEALGMRLQEAAADAARGLAADPEAELDELLAWSFACRHEPDACPEARARTTRAVAPYLPPGAQAELAFENGVAAMPLLGLPPPPGPAAASSVTVAPGWAFAFVVADLSCHDATLGPTLHLLPLHGGAVAPAHTMTVRLDGQPHDAQPGEDGWWRAALPALPEGERHLDVEGAGRRGAYAGRATVGACALEGHAGALQHGLAESHLAVDPPAGWAGHPPGHVARLRYDLRPLLEAVPDATLRDVRLEVHAPLATEPGGFPVVATVAGGPGPEGSGAWRVPDATLYGHHPVVLVATLDVATAHGVVALEARKATAVAVALPGGALPPVALYGLTVTVWHPEWRA